MARAGATWLMALLLAASSDMRGSAALTVASITPNPLTVGASVRLMINLEGVTDADLAGPRNSLRLRWPTSERGWQTHALDGWPAAGSAPADGKVTCTLTRSTERRWPETGPIEVRIRAEYLISSELGWHIIRTADCRQGEAGACRVLFEGAPLPTRVHSNNTAPMAGLQNATEKLGAARLSDPISIEFGGRTRSALLYVPASAPPGAVLPLVFNYHGLGSDGLQQVFYSFNNPLADEETFAVIYPDGTPSPMSHNGGSCCAPANRRLDPVDDVGCASAWAAHVAALLDARGLSLDRERVYATGMSNGGFMALRLGCQSASLFAAVATVTGLLGNDFDGLPTTDDFPCDLESTGGLPVPMLHIHGTGDSTVPYSGAARGIEVFRALNRCSGTGAPSRTYSNGAATCASYCPAPLPNVTLCSVEGGGHEWFGSPLCGIVSGNAAGCADLDSTRQIWDFFKRHKRELAP